MAENGVRVLVTYMSMSAQPLKADDLASLQVKKSSDDATLPYGAGGDPSFIPCSKCQVDNGTA